ncbi:MAG TPA: hypothetical protein VMM60_03070 [Ilumatobacter sp.]|nr:hypothetical protein [Ilumatobacter sp.]
MLSALAAMLIVSVATLATAAAPAAAVDDSDWLTIVNTYRAMSGLSAVDSNEQWVQDATNHSCYMLLNDIAHDEIPGNPGYTVGGDLAGNNGNVAVSGSTAANARSHIDLWMTGPFHAIGVLRHNLVTTAYGECEDESALRWKSGATLDVLRGLNLSAPRPSSPIVFPGNGATVPLNRFITESPNPVTLCGWTGNAGLPLIAMMPTPVTNANSSLTGPNGPIETCTLHGGNTGGNGTARAILNADNAIVVMPRDVLADGAYTATIESDAGPVSWTFNVNRYGGLAAAEPVFADTSPSSSTTRFSPTAPFRLVDSREGAGAVRLAGGAVTRIRVADADVAAVSANFVAVHPGDVGFLTAYNCTSEVPIVSMIGYGTGDVLANQAIVPLDQGDLCLYSLRDTDIVIDVNGYFTADGGSGFMPVTPKRIFNTADGGGAMSPLTERSITIAGQEAPTDATAVALNVTAVYPASAGYVQVYPCGAASSSEFSTVNYQAYDFRPNSVIVPVGDDGKVCFQTLTESDLIIDFTGYFAEKGGLSFLPLDPIRMFDSRSPYDSLNTVTNGSKIAAGQVARIRIAGARGVPDDARAVSANLTATGVGGIGTYLTAFPCGVRPDASNVNITPADAATANGTLVKLSADGDLCVYTLDEVHIIVDVNGVWL